VHKIKDQNEKATTPLAEESKQILTETIPKIPDPEEEHH